MRWLLATLALVVSLNANAKTRVAVIDTGLDLSDPRFAGKICPDAKHWNFVADSPMRGDEHGHGTHVAGLIMQYAGKADFCFLIYKYYSDANPGSVNLRNTVKAFKQAIADRADVINYSGGGPEFSEDEYLALREATTKGIKIVAAAGNDRLDTDLIENYYYPASYRLPGMTVVGAMDPNCKGRLQSSNFGKRITTWQRGENLKSTLPNGREGYMSGTSQATAIATGKIVAGNLTPCTPEPKRCPAWAKHLVNDERVREVLTGCQIWD